MKVEISDKVGKGNGRGGRGGLLVRNVTSPPGKSEVKRLEEDVK